MIERNTRIEAKFHARISRAADGAIIWSTQVQGQKNDTNEEIQVTKETAVWLAARNFFQDLFPQYKWVPKVQEDSALSDSGD